MTARVIYRDRIGDERKRKLIVGEARSLDILGSGDQDAPSENSHGESALLRLAELAQELDADQAAADRRSVAKRASEGHFYVACIGEFKPDWRLVGV